MATFINKDNKTIKLLLDRSGSMRSDGMLKALISGSNSLILEQRQSAEDLNEDINIEICNICMDHNSDCLTKCQHQFCKNCLDIWYKKNNKCPYCREYLQNSVYKL